MDCWEFGCIGLEIRFVGVLMGFWIILGGWIIKLKFVDFELNLEKLMLCLLIICILNRLWLLYGKISWEINDWWFM